MARVKRHYSDEDKAAALAFVDSLKGNVKAASKATGVPYNTLKYWIQEMSSDPSVANIRNQKRLDLKALWETEAQLALKDAQVCRDEANYSQLIIAAGIATEKIMALDKASALTPEQFTRVMADIESVILHHIPDLDAREKIADELERIAESVGGAPSR